MAILRFKRILDLNIENQAKNFVIFWDLRGTEMTWRGHS